MGLTKTCIVCRQKHVKCDGQSPCGRCIKYSATCEYPQSRRGGFRIPRRLKFIATETLDDAANCKTAYEHLSRPSFHWLRFVPPSINAADYFDRLDQTACRELFLVLEMTQHTHATSSGLVAKTLFAVADIVASTPVFDLVSLQSVYIGLLFSQMHTLEDHHVRFRHLRSLVLEGGGQMRHGEQLLTQRLASVNMIVLEQLRDCIYMNFDKLEVLCSLASSHIPQLYAQEKITREVDYVINLGNAVANYVAHKSRAMNDDGGRSDHRYIDAFALKADVASWQGRLAQSELISVDGRIDEDVVFCRMIVNYCAILLYMDGSRLLRGVSVNMRRMSMSDETSSTNHNMDNNEVDGKLRINCSRADAYIEVDEPPSDLHHVKLPSPPSGQILTDTWHCIRAANNITQIAMDCGIETVQNRTPMYTCCMAIACVVHTMAQATPCNVSPSIAGLDKHILQTLGLRWPIASKLCLALESMRTVSRDQQQEHRQQQQQQHDTSDSTLQMQIEFPEVGVDLDLCEIEFNAS